MPIDGSVGRAARVRQGTEGLCAPPLYGWPGGVRRVGCGEWVGGAGRTNRGSFANLGRHFTYLIFGLLGLSGLSGNPRRLAGVSYGPPGMELRIATMQARFRRLWPVSRHVRTVHTAAQHP